MHVLTTALNTQSLARKETNNPRWMPSANNLASGLQPCCDGKKAISLQFLEEEGYMVHGSGGVLAADNRTVGIKSENAAGPQKQHHPHTRCKNNVALAKSMVDYDEFWLPGLPAVVYGWPHGQHHHCCYLLLRGWSKDLRAQ